MPACRGRLPIPRVVDAIQQQVDLRRMPGSQPVRSGHSPCAARLLGSGFPDVFEEVGFGQERLLRRCALVEATLFVSLVGLLRECFLVSWAAGLG